LQFFITQYTGFDAEAHGGRVRDNRQQAMGEPGETAYLHLLRGAFSFPGRD